MISQHKQADESTDTCRHLFGAFPLFQQLKSQSSQLVGALGRCSEGQVELSWGSTGGQAGTQTRCEQKSQKGVREGPAQSLCCLICAKKHQCAISGAGLDPLGAFQLNIFYDSMKYFSICNHWQLLDTNLRVSGVNGKKWFL